jgi:FG-GAP-like repeat
MLLKSFLLRSSFFLTILASLPAQQFADQTAARLPAQAIWTEAIAAGDVDGDGDLDLVYGKGDGFSGAGTPRQSTICINNGLGVFTDQTAARFPAMTANTKDIELFDIDGDGDLDVLLANGFGQQPRVWINNGAGVFADGTAARFPVLTLNSFAVVGGDLDNDGDIDLIFTDSGASTFGAPGGQPRVFQNNGAGFFTNVTATHFPVVTLQASVEADLVDVDGDFDLDVTVTSRDASPSRLFVNNGAGVFTAGPVLPADGTGTYDYTTGDLDGDNDADIFVVGQNGLAEGVFTNNGLGTYALAAGAVVGNVGSDDNVSVFGDIDNDGDFDVAVAALSTQERIFVNNGAGVLTYNAGLITAIVDSSLDAVFVDVDNDGDVDLATAVGESGAFQNRLYMNVTGVMDTRQPVIRLQTLNNSTPAGPVAVHCGIRDITATKNDPEYTSVTLNYSVNGNPGSTAMAWAGGDLFRGLIPWASFGSTVQYSVTAIDRKNNTTTSSTVTFSPMVYGPPTLIITTTGVGDATITIIDEAHPNGEEFLFASTILSNPLGSGPFIGLSADAFNMIFTPIGTPPLHDYLNGVGWQITNFPPFSLPAGLSVDARAAVVANPPVLTNLVRVTF